MGLSPRRRSLWVLPVLVVASVSPAAAEEGRVAASTGAASQAQRRIEAPSPLEASVDYPANGEGSHVVILELLVQADGSVGEVSVVSGAEPFGAAAIAAARGWRFSPAKLDGKVVPARIRFEVAFEPPQEEPADADEASEPAASEEARSEEPNDPPPPLEMVVVEGERSEGALTLTRAEVRQLPGVFGDAFRAVEVLPGVTPIVSGLPYFYVRGAPPGNVGYFLDGIRVPLLFHIGAGPSVIHPAFIDTVDLHAGPYPARYGRFTGGIIAGTTAPPAYEHRGEASIRLVDAGGMVETHAFDRRLSVMLGGRYSYLALMASLIAPDLNISYWDYQGRLQYRIDDDQTLTLFAFGALDKASEQRKGEPNVSIFDLTFHRYDLRYDRQLEGGGHLRVATLFGTEVTGGDVFALRDRLLGARVELEQPLSDTVFLRAGTDVQTDRYTIRLDDPNALLGDSGESFDENGEPVETDSRDSNDLFPARLDVATGVQGDLVWEAATGVRVIPGARFDLYTIDTDPFWAISPRLRAEFDVRKNVMLHHGLGVAHQRPSFIVPLPGVQPAGAGGLQRAIQHSAGVVLSLPEDMSAEATVFQNIQLNVTDPLSGLRFQEAEQSLDGELRSQGSARGFELMFRRSLSQRVGGFLSYTLSHSRRSLGRQEGPSSFDRTHVLGAALGYQMGKGWIAGARGSFYTGIPAQELGPGHSFQAPPRTTPFYRFDWRLEKRWMVGTEGAWWSFVMEVLNTTLNKEMLTLTCVESNNCYGEKIGPITIPSIGVEASF